MRAQRSNIRQVLSYCLFSMGLALPACAPVGPEYQAPKLEPPAEWRSPIGDGLRLANGETDQLLSWWETFGDALLHRYVRQALLDNNGLAEARAALLSARAKRDLSASTLLPSASLGASLSRQGRFEEDSDASSRFGSAFDSLWELDLFGGNRRTLEATERRVAAVEAKLGDAQISLCAEVAQSYLEARTYQQRAEIAGKSLAAQERLLLLTEAKKKAGLVGEAAVHQARAQVAAVRAQLPVLHAGMAQAENVLTTLLGLMPGALRQELAVHPGRLVIPDSVAVAIPAAVLERRPDVRRAERLLAAQVAEIGAAEAARYPTVRLSGAISFDALSFGQVFNAASGTYAITPRISWSLFDGGAVAANIALQTSLADESLAAFKATVLSALAEVETTMGGYVRERQRLAALGEAVQAAARSLELAENQYRAGLVELATVLEAHRALLSAEDQQVTSFAGVIGSLIKLYKALGGGWQTADGHPSQPGGNGGA